jgi:hypothetical protein
LNVLIIPEDSSKDRYILNPIIEAMIKSASKPRAKIRIYEGRKPHGIDQVLRWERIKEIIDSYPQVDLFLLIVDRDGDEHRRSQLDSLENRATAVLVGSRRLFAEHAWQELEVWALAGCDDLPRRWRWRAVRDERDPKEVYFTPYARLRGLESEPGGGRRTLGREAAGQYNRICRRCPEITSLEMRILDWINRERI